MPVVVLHQAHRRLHRLLTQSAAPLSVLFTQTDTLSLSGTFPGLLVVAGTHQLSVHCAQEPVILIVRRPDELPKKLDCPHTIAVIDSANPALREEIAARKIPALTCGRSDTDTFTLTSLTTDSAVISLSRRICAFDHSNIDPFELPVLLSQPLDPFDLLACAAVFCLLGQANPLSLQEKWSPCADTKSVLPPSISPCTNQ